MNTSLEDMNMRWRQARFNPLRYLTPEKLSAALDSWQAGWLREAALIFETIEQRDAIVRSVMTKRRAAVARRPWQIVIPDPSDPRGQAHKQTLEYFYQNLPVADGLGEALAVCYMFKRLSLQDWLAFSEKFSVPGILGRTKAAADSDEGRTMAESVAAYASEWAGVIYGDDGTIPEPIKIIQTPGAESQPPQELARYMDRMIAALVRGADLGTLSQGNSQGASIQAPETAALLEDDCALVSETLQTQLDRQVIRAVHGDDKPAAYVVIKPPPSKSLTADLEVDTQLDRLGVRQTPAALAERYGRTLGKRQSIS